MSSLDDFMASQGIPKINSGNSLDQYMQEHEIPQLKSTTILPQKTNITQNFNTYNPDLEVFSGGRARDTNFSSPMDTPVFVPRGTWRILKTFDNASRTGSIGDSSNQGYGNAVLAQNVSTKEKLHMIHLSQVGVKPEDILEGGTQIGSTGSSGNATGPNLGIEYYDAQGNLGDILNTPYSKALPTQ